MTPAIETKKAMNGILNVVQKIGLRTARVLAESA